MYMRGNRDGGYNLMITGTLLDNWELEENIFLNVKTWLSLVHIYFSHHSHEQTKTTLQPAICSEVVISGFRILKGGTDTEPRVTVSVPIDKRKYCLGPNMSRARSISKIQIRNRRVGMKITGTKLEIFISPNKCHQTIFGHLTITRVIRIRALNSVTWTMIILEIT